MAVRSNPPLVIFGNPPEEISERATLRAIASRINRLYTAAMNGDKTTAEIERAVAAEHVERLLRQVERGVHTNPKRTKIAQGVQAIVYINATDRQPYAHGFGNADLNEKALQAGRLLMSDLKEHTDVCAYGNVDGTITLEGKRGQRLWKFFRQEDDA